MEQHFRQKRYKNNTFVDIDTISAPFNSKSTDFIYSNGARLKLIHFMDVKKKEKQKSAFPKIMLGKNWNMIGDVAFAELGLQFSHSHQLRCTPSFAPTHECGTRTHIRRNYCKAMIFHKVIQFLHRNWCFEMIGKWLWKWDSDVISSYDMMDVDGNVFVCCCWLLLSVWSRSDS